MLLKHLMCLTFTSVPVVAIFTKFDGHIIKAAARLKREPYLQNEWPDPEGYADFIFQKEYLSQINQAKYPPTKTIQLQGKC